MTAQECEDCHAPAGTVCSDMDCPGRPKGAPTLEDFCNVANDLYAAPTEERFYAVVNLARELLIQASRRWDDGYQFGRSEVAALQAANVALAGAIDMIRETLDGSDVQDLRQIINAALAKHRAPNDQHKGPPKAVPLDAPVGRPVDKREDVSMKAKPVRREPGGYVQCAADEATHLTLRIPGPTGLLTLPVVHGNTTRAGTGAWSWNGSVESPTLRPSVLTQYDGADRSWRCHSWINDGAARFLDDCSHSLRGQTVLLLDVDETDQTLKGLTPEHDKRNPEQDYHENHPDVQAAYLYVARVRHTADIMLSGVFPAWHGWALREAFLAGISHSHEVRSTSTPGHE